MSSRRVNESLIAGSVVSLVLGAQEVFRDIITDPGKDARSEVVIAIVVGSGLIAGLTCTLLIRVISSSLWRRWNSATNIAGIWSLEIWGNDGSIYRRGHVHIQQSSVGIDVSGRNEDSTGAHTSLWTSSAAWLEKGRLTFLYEVAQTTNSPILKLGVMTARLEPGLPPVRMDAHWCDYQPSQRTGGARFTRMP